MTVKRFLLLILVGLALWILWGLNRPHHFTENAFAISDLRTPESNAAMVSLTCPRETKRDRETCGCIRTEIYANTSMFERYLFTYGNSWITGYGVWQGGRNAGLTTAEIRKMSDRVNRLVPELSRQCEIVRAAQLKNQQSIK
jgi:hypothetical protein